MRNFQGTFETSKRLFASAFSVCMTVTSSWATIPHINSKINPPSPLPILLAGIWDSFLSQALVLLLFQYTATLSRGGGSDLIL